jgi:MFS family permease
MATTPIPAPDLAKAPYKPGRRRWVMLALLAALMVINLAERTNFSVAGPLIMRDMKLSNADFGLILSLFQWTYGLMTLVAGLSVDRYGPRMILGASAFAWGIIAALTGQARSFIALIGFRSALGAVESPVFSGLMKVVTAWFPDRERGLASSICFATFQISTVIIIPITTLLMLSFGWRDMLLGMGLFALIPAVAWVVLYRDPQHDKRLTYQERRYIVDGQASRDTSSPTPISGREWLSLFRHRQTWTMFVGGFCRQYADGFNLWLPLYFVQAWHLSMSQMGMIAGLPSAGAAAGLIIGGRFSDRLIRGGGEVLAARRRTLVLSIVASAVISLLLALSQHYLMALALLTLGAMAHGFGHASWWMMAAAVPRTERFIASLSSIQNFGGLLAMVAGPVVLGVLLDMGVGYAPVFLLTAALSLCAAMIYGLLLQPTTRF